MYWRDVPREHIPLGVWLNPLRYQVSFTTRKGKLLFHINHEGRWAGRISWRIRKLFGNKP